MRETLLDYLAPQKIGSQTVVHATQYYLGQRINDLSTEEMRANLIRAGADNETIDLAFSQLIEDSVTLENACLAFLSWGWEQGDDDKIRDAILAATKKLPVIELAILAMVAMYGMYLVATGGVAKQTVTKLPDGTYKKETTYHGPTGPLGQLVALVKGQLPKDHD